MCTHGLKRGAHILPGQSVFMHTPVYVGKRHTHGFCVYTLFIHLGPGVVMVAVISSNKNIMHREERFERTVVVLARCDGFSLTVTMAQTSFGPWDYECFISQASV